MTRQEKKSYKIQSLSLLIELILKECFFVPSLMENSNRRRLHIFLHLQFILRSLDNIDRIKAVNN